MTAARKSMVLGIGMIVVGFAFVLVALAMVLPVAVNLPESWFGAMLAFAVLALGIACLYFGGQRIWGVSSK
jgi:hypothetical protein